MPYVKRRHRPNAPARVAICIRITMELEERRRRLEDLLELSTPELFEHAVGVLEAKVAEEAAA
jgi:hypothetical protein